MSFETYHLYIPYEYETSVMSNRISLNRASISANYDISEIAVEEVVCKVFS